MILHVEHAKQGIRENCQLPPSIDYLGAHVHEVQSTGQGGLDDGSLGVVQVGLEQVYAVDAQLGEIGPALAELLDAFVARLSQHQDEGVHHIAVPGLLLPPL